MGPDDASEPPGWFLPEMERLSRTETKPPEKPPFIFEVGTQAAETNGELLRKHDFDLGRIIGTNAGTTLGYGSEFRPVETLKPFIGSHPNFGKLEIVLSQGMTYEFLRDLDEHTKSLELKTLLKRGNHKSAKALPEVVPTLFAKDVTHGFAIPIFGMPDIDIKEGAIKLYKSKQHGKRNLLPTVPYYLFLCNLV